VLSCTVSFAFRNVVMVDAVLGKHEQFGLLKGVTYGKAVFRWINKKDITFAGPVPFQLPLVS
jgi:hypothetical protein